MPNSKGHDHKHNFKPVAYFEPGKWEVENLKILIIFECTLCDTWCSKEAKKL